MQPLQTVNMAKHWRITSNANHIWALQTWPEEFQRLHQPTRKPKTTIKKYWRARFLENLENFNEKNLRYRLFVVRYRLYFCQVCKRFSLNTEAFIQNCFILSLLFLLFFVIQLFWKISHNSQKKSVKKLILDEFLTFI